MLQLDENISIGADDKISLKSGDQILKGIVLNSGEGTSTPEDDEFYWLHAPSKGVQYSNPSEVHTRFLLIKIDNSDIPFVRLPGIVMVQKDNHNEWFCFIVTSIIGLSENKGGYLIYSELEK